MKQGFNLRAYQVDAVTAILKDYKDGYYKVGCILPTGAGKTEIMLSLSDFFIDQYGGKVLILSHMGLLVGQTSERAGIRIPHRKIGWLKAEHIPKPTDDIVVGTMQSARVAEKLEHVADVSLIIIDEAHFITAKSYQDIIERNPSARILGLTATPFKAKRLMTNHFEKVSYCAALQDMIDQGYLLPPKLIAVEQANDDVTVDVAALYKAKEMGKKTIVFMPTVEEAVLMSKVFEMEGVKARTIVGSTPEGRRKYIIDEFQNKNVDVLCTVDVLTAGFDAPCVEAIIMPVRCGSPTTFMQRVGRGLRKYKNKEECRVYFFGKVPNIEKKFYEDMVKLTFNAKKEKLDLFEQLEWAKYEDDVEQIIYCQKMLKIHNDMKSLGYEWFSKMIAQDKLSDDLMGRIDLIHQKISGVRVKHQDRNPSPKQVEYLEGVLGVNLVNDMKVGEANALISALSNLSDKVHPIYGDQWACTSGLHKGKHIKDVPFPYIQWCMLKQPSSNVCKLFHRWNQFKKELQRV